MQRDHGIGRGLVSLLVLLALSTFAMADDAGSSGSTTVDCGDLINHEVVTRCESARRCGEEGNGRWALKYRDIEIGVGGDYKDEDGGGDADNCCRRLLTEPSYEEPIWPGDYKLKYIGSVQGLIETGNCKRSRALGFLWTTSWSCEYENPRLFGWYDQWIKTGPCGEQKDAPKVIID